MGDRQELEALDGALQYVEARGWDSLKGLPTANAFCCEKMAKDMVQSLANLM